MAEAETAERVRSGTAADRAPPPARVSTTATYGLSGGLILAWIHWLMKCYHPGSGWDWHVPDDALLEITIASVLPIVHLIGRIIKNHLQRLAGEQA